VAEIDVREALTILLARKHFVGTPEDPRLVKLYCNATILQFRKDAESIPNPAWADKV